MPLQDEMMDGLDVEQDVEQMCAIMGLKLEDFLAEINYRQQVKFREAMRIQVLAANRQSERRIIRSGDTGGEVTMQIHPTLYHGIARRYGPEAMKDESFVKKDLLKAHPELRVRSRSDRLTIIKPEIAGNSAPNKRRGVHGRRGRWAA